MIRKINGRHNRTVKLARKLQKKKHRKERGLFVAEGMDLLDAAEDASRHPVDILVREDLADRLPSTLSGSAAEDAVDIGLCTEELLRHASGMGGAVDVVSIMENPEWSLGDIEFSGIVVYMYCVGDPGNVGTLVRAAAAFGAEGVICSPKTADAFSPKAIRAGMGAQFSVKIAEEVTPEDLEAKLRADQQRGEPSPRVVLADPRAEQTVGDVASNDGAVLVLGSERGAYPEMTLPYERAAVPQRGLDSLNVAIAGSIMLYELTGARLGKGSQGLLGWNPAFGRRSHPR